MSGDVLFSDTDLFSGDPLNPDTIQVCPPEVVVLWRVPSHYNHVHVTVA